MSPRTPKQFEEMREEKKTLIMDVALEHFAKEGYQVTTISHIAKHAGISKGLMYNYFEGKETLLYKIIERSLEEISDYFDPDRDGYLSESEFELFIRKTFYLLKEKRSFWRLFFQLIMQKDVRDQFLKFHLTSNDGVNMLNGNRRNSLFTLYSKMITEYFVRKKERKPADYDPVVDMNLFLYTLEGFSFATAYFDEVEGISYDKTIRRIIELYK